MFDKVLEIINAEDIVLYLSTIGWPYDYPNTSKYSKLVVSASFSGCSVFFAFDTVDPAICSVIAKIFVDSRAEMHPSSSCLFVI